MSGYGSGRLPKQNVGEKLGEARAAQWVNEQETERRERAAAGSAGKQAATSTKQDASKKHPKKKTASN